MKFSNVVSYYSPARDSITHSVCRSVHQSAGPSISRLISHTLLHRRLWASFALNNVWLAFFFITAPAQLHATCVVVYPALFSFEIGIFSLEFQAEANLRPTIWDILFSSISIYKLNETYPKTFQVGPLIATDNITKFTQPVNLFPRAMKNRIS